MDLDAEEHESIFYILVPFSLLVTAFAENDFPTVLEEIESYVARPFYNCYY